MSDMGEICIAPIAVASGYENVCDGIYIIDSERRLWYGFRKTLPSCPSDGNPPDYYWERVNLPETNP